MPTLDDVDLQRGALDDIITLAKAELLALWPTMPVEDPEELKKILVPLFVELVGEYGSMAALLASDWYDDLRAEARAGGSYVAFMAATATAEAMGSEVEYAAAGAYKSPVKALIDAAAVLDKYVGYGQRDTIDLNVANDKALSDREEPGVRWARFAQDDACAFCALLATRGEDYRTEASALRTTGAGARPSRQGKRDLGEKYHDDCRCIAVPVFTGIDYEYPSMVPTWSELYDDAVTSLPSGARNTKAVLAYMREHGGLR